MQLVAPFLTTDSATEVFDFVDTSAPKRVRRFDCTQLRPCRRLFHLGDKVQLSSIAQAGVFVENAGNKSLLGLVWPMRKHPYVDEERGFRGSGNAAVKGAGQAAPFPWMLGTFHKHGSRH